MEKGELVLEDRLYTDTHEWVKKVGENRYQIGITDLAQYLLKEIQEIDLPRIGVKLKQFEEWGSIDSSKTSSVLYSPIGGKVIATNQENFGEVNNANNPGEGSPTTFRYIGEFYNLNKKPYETWLIEIEADDESQLTKLLKPDDYKKEVEKHKTS
ncbi:hypothetical protein FJZ53_07430 [Candidatus Woesearchaeota archaeon]|nr:hypothetical protein [Candidatus Woesearchaeota archaeon]